MEIFDLILGRLDKINPGLEAITKYITRPVATPVLKIDSQELATGIMPHLAAHKKAMEDAAARMEAAAASIPRSVPTQWGIDPSTRWFMFFSIALIMVSVGVGYLVTPKLERQHINYLQRANESQAAELNYLRRKNPRDAAQYARDNGR